MFVRRERDEDASAIAAVHTSAFGGDEEATLAGALRESGAAMPELSLVVELDETGVVGHVVCSRGDLGGVAVAGLGPIGVTPRHQRCGAGCALMHAVIGAADALDEPMLVLLGDPDFYRRFGFRPARDVGIEPPVDAWRDNFQVRTLSAYDPSLRGTYRYAAAFG